MPDDVTLAAVDDYLFWWEVPSYVWLELEERMGVPRKRQTVYVPRRDCPGIRVALARIASEEPAGV